MSDFYVILPSNACANVHPENVANKYLVSWENPINVNSTEWKVALTEANFNYAMCSVNTNFGLRYKRISYLEHTFQCDLYISGDETLSMDVEFAAFVPEFHSLPPPANLTFDNWKRPRVSADTEGHIIIEADNNFSMSFASKEDAAVCGFVTDSGDYVFDAEQHGVGPEYILKGYQPVPKTLEVAIRNVVFKYKSRPFNMTEEVFVSEEKLYETTVAMLTALSHDFRDVFRSMAYDNGQKRLTLQVKDDITGLEFLNGFNIILGFRNRVMDVNTKGQELKSDYAPDLRRGISHMYIYASVCNPIQVGGVRVPLLKSIWLDNRERNYKFGETRNFVVKNPMYIPLCTSSMNIIEVNIRSDSGKLIPFVDGSVTSLTLHFKRSINAG